MTGVQTCALPIFGRLVFKAARDRVADLRCILLGGWRLLRRGGAAPAPKKGGVLKSGGLKLDLAVREATRDGALLELTYKEFELLRELMENAPGAMSRDELLQSVWGYDFIGETRTLDMHIGTLRHKLGDESTAPRYIKTVRGVGYRFLGEVEKEG